MREVEVKNKMLECYKMNKDICDKKYNDAVNIETMRIYREERNEQEIIKLLFKTSVVILTANPFEKNILHLNVAADNNKKIIHSVINICENQKNETFINAFFFYIGEHFILHLEAKQTGSYSIGGSADLVRYIVNNKYCYPYGIISFGICFGNDINKQSLGDTIIAKKMYPYFISAKIKDQKFVVVDSNIFEIDNKLESNIKYLIDIGCLHENKNIYYGNMITGEAVISNTLIKEIFIKAATNQEILGGEMEGYGLFKECQYYSKSIPCLLIKSICDWGEYKNLDDTYITEMKLKDKIQTYAADCAYNVLSIILTNEYTIFDISIYEQIKKAIHEDNDDIIHQALLKNLLKKITSPKKIIEDDICELILKLLVEDNLIYEKSKEIFKMKKKGKKKNGIQSKR